MGEIPKVSVPNFAILKPSIKSLNIICFRITRLFRSNSDMNLNNSLSHTNKQPRDPSKKLKFGCYNPIKIKCEHIHCTMMS